MLQVHLHLMGDLRMKRSFVFAWILALYLGMCFWVWSPANSAPVKTIVSFEASGFRLGAPSDPVTGTIAFLFDFQDAKATDSTPVLWIDLTIDGLSYSADEVSYFYNPLLDFFMVGAGIPNGTGSYINDFGLWIAGFVSGAYQPGFHYGTTNYNFDYADQVAVEVVRESIPAPAALGIVSLLALLGRRLFRSSAP